MLKRVFCFCMLFWLGAGSAPAIGQTAMEFVYPSPFHNLRAPVKRFLFTYDSATNLSSSGFFQDMDKVPSGVWLKDTQLNPQDHPDFKQLVIAEAGVENVHLGVGYWVFSPGSEMKGNNSIGIDHDGEIVCSCNSPDHFATMILPAGVKTEGRMDVYWGEQFVYGDYHAKTALHNGGYQIIYPGATVYADMGILYQGESNILGTVAEGAVVDVLPGGVLRLEDEGRIEGTLNVEGGLAFVYEDTFVNKAHVVDEGTFYSIARWLDDDPKIGKLEVLGGRADLSVGEINSVYAELAGITISDPGRLVRSPGARVKGEFYLSGGSKLTLVGDTTPLSLDSAESSLEVSGGEISLSAGAWQTTSTIRSLNGNGKIIFNYHRGKFSLMDDYPMTPMPITRLVILNGGGEFELAFNAQVARKAEDYALRPVPDEFVVVEDHSNGGISFSYPEEVEIEGRSYKMEARGESPTLWVLHTEEPLAVEEAPQIPADNASSEVENIQLEAGPETAAEAETETDAAAMPIPPAEANATAE